MDIGAASREIKDEELPIVKHLLARDGIAIVVKPGNPVTALTKAQVRDIFGGVITNWKDVGGPNASHPRGGPGIGVRHQDRI